MGGDPGGGSAWVSDGGEVMQFREELRFRHLRGGLAGPGPGGRQGLVPRSEAILVDGAPPWAAFVHLCCGRGLAKLDGKGLQIVYQLRRRNRALRPGVVEAGRLQRVAPRTKAGAKRAVGVFAVLAGLADRRRPAEVVGDRPGIRAYPVVAAPCRPRGDRRNRRGRVRRPLRRRVLRQLETVASAGTVTASANHARGDRPATEALTALREVEFETSGADGQGLTPSSPEGVPLEPPY